MSILYEFTSGGLYFHHSADLVPDPASFDMHTHDTLELLCIMSGRGRFFVEGNYYPLIKNSVFIIRANESHKLHIESSAAYERAALRFPETMLLGVDPEKYLIRPFSDRAFGNGNLFTSSETGIDFIERFRAMIPESGAGEYRRRLAIASFLPGLLYELEGYFQINRSNLPPDTPKEIVAAVIDYINSHLFDDFSLDSISEKFFISKSYLNRRFKAATGSTLWNYVIIKRLMVAREEIHSGQPATKVYSACGFKDYSGFYRQYKERFGVTPKEDK